MQFIAIEEGRVVWEEDGTKYPEYFLKDHLGNTRVRIADKNGDNLVYIDQNNPEEDELMNIRHYYPFGMEWDMPLKDMAGNPLAESELKNKYSYNGKEYIDDLGINLHDYGARQYDPAIARWTSVDPLAEEYTPFSTYNYTLNNPIRFIDPDGRGVDDHIFLNSKGKEIGRIVNDEEDRYFTEVSSCGSDGGTCSNFVEVNSPETLSGDPKAQNPWNGSTADLEVGELNEDVGQDVENILDEHDGSSLKAAYNESQPYKTIDYMRDVNDGTIYQIDGVYYNSHETLNLKWGMAMKKLGFSSTVAVQAANEYHAYSFMKEKFKGGNRYSRVGIHNEKNHQKAIKTGFKISTL